MIHATRVSLSFTLNRQLSIGILKNRRIFKQLMMTVDLYLKFRTESVKKAYKWHHWYLHCCFFNVNYWIFPHELHMNGVCHKQWLLYFHLSNTSIQYWWNKFYLESILFETFWLLISLWRNFSLALRYSLYVTCCSWHKPLIAKRALYSF